MTMSRAELDANLYQLHAAIPLWRRVLLTESSVRNQYQLMSERILAETSGDHRQWVEFQLRELMSSLTSVHHPASRLN